MKFFPYSLLRIPSLSSDEFAPISHSDIGHLINDYCETENSFKRIENTIVDAVNGYLDLNFYVRIKIIEALRNRNFQKFHKLLNKENVTDDRIIEWHRNLASINDQRLAIVEQITKMIEEISKEEKAIFSNLIVNHHFKNAFLYATGSITADIKKESDTILKYITRALFKTSPFSSFTVLNFSMLNNTITESKFEEMEIESTVSMQNLIKRQLQISIEYLELTHGYFDLEIELNNSISVLEDSGLLYTYVCNNYNVERISKVFLNDSINELLNTNLLHKFNNLSKLRKHYLDNSQLDTNSIDTFIKGLFTIGLIKFNIEFSESANKWVNEVQSLFAESSINDDAKRDLVQSFSSINNLLIKLTKYNEDVLHKVSHFSLIRDQLTTIQTVINSLSKSSIINVPNKKILYEDCKLNSKVDLDKEGVKRLITKLNKLLPIINNSVNQRAEYVSFFNLRYNQSEEIPLLIFYEEYCKNILHFNNSKSNSIETDYYKASLKGPSFEQNRIYPILDLVEFEIENNLVKISSASFNQKTQEKFANDTKGGLYSGLFHFAFNEDNKIEKMYLTAVGSGYGRMFSRFLNFSGEDTNLIIDKIRKWNVSFQSADQIWVDLTDFSSFNANVHPSLMPFQIKYFGDSSSSHNVLIQDLIVHMHEKDLRIKDKRTNKTVFFYDLGFQHINGRSQLYQFLSKFNQSHSFNLGFLLSKIGRQFQELKNGKEERQIQIAPRIVFDNDIIIQRCCWIVKRISLIKIVSDPKGFSNQFIALNTWVKENRIPNEVFVRVERNNSHFKQSINSDNYKPQYINFQSPELVSYFIKLLVKVGSDDILIEEMYPTRNDQMTINKRKHVTEHYIQWYNN